MPKIELKGYLGKPSYFKKVDSPLELTNGLLEIFFYGNPEISEEAINKGEICKITIEVSKE